MLGWLGFAQGGGGASSSQEELTGTVTLALILSGDVTATGDVSRMILNSNATTDVPNHFEIDDRTWFRELPGVLKRDGHIEGLLTTKKAHDSRHPQEFVRSGSDKLRGPQRPEQDDNFLTDNEITVDDL